MDERPSPVPTGHPFAASVDEAVAALGHAIRREVRRTIMGLVLGLLSIVLVLVVALGFTVAGVMRLGDALAQFFGRWLGDQALGDMTVGIVLLVLPLIGALVLRLRSWW